MAINKIDIYGAEWIELVFKDRNKSYGAYDLRKHYTANVLKALGIAFGAMAALVYIATLLLKSAPITAKPLAHEVTTVVKQVLVEAPETYQPIHHTHHHNKNGYSYSPAPAIITPKAIAPTAPIPAAVPVQPIETNTAPITVESSNEIFGVTYADVKPMPQGGAQGWMSFLQNNLVYPADARRAGISGKTWLSFVVEKDGSLSNITVDNGAGHGFDEEAVRVLRLSPIWQPGIKDGQPVRIKYRLPVNFQMMK